MTTLIDSGAAKSMMKTDKWREICSRTNQPLALQQGLQLRSLSGHMLPTKGLATIQTLGKSCEFYVTDSLQHDVLLGIDALNVLGMVLNCEDGTVLLGGERFKWGKYDILVFSDSH